MGAIYAAVILGAAGVGCALLAVRRGARPAIRPILAGAAIAVAVLTVLPPAGSTDSISYATYGRIADIGHNPYVMTPAQLRASGDPIGLQTTRNWENDPSLYGPLATGAQWGAARLGGTSIGRIIFWLKLLFAVAFGAIALTLDRLLRGDPAARIRAHLLWTVNPLMLWAVLGGGHIDGLAAGLGLIGLDHGPPRPGRWLRAAGHRDQPGPGAGGRDAGRRRGRHQEPVRPAGDRAGLGLAAVAGPRWRPGRPGLPSCWCPATLSPGRPPSRT